MSEGAKQIPANREHKAAHASVSESDSSTFQLKDNRPEAIAQRKVQALANRNALTQPAVKYQQLSNQFSTRNSPLVQRRSIAKNPTVVMQRQVDPQQLAWRENYKDSGLTIADIFSDDQILSGDTSNDVHRGIFAHEFIQAEHGSWTKEYGIPPAGGGWSYADMAKEKAIYEIKPEGGVEDAVTQAIGYVSQANRSREGHVRATARLGDRKLMVRKTLTARDFRLNRDMDDTFELYLNYRNNAPGEVLYKWEIINVSKDARRRERERIARAEAAAKKKAEKTAKGARGMRPLS